MSDERIEENLRNVVNTNESSVNYFQSLDRVTKICIFIFVHDESLLSKFMVPLRKLIQLTVTDLSNQTK